jgi:hypothetical protein
MILWYRADGNAMDSSGWDHHGIATNIIYSAGIRDQTFNFSLAGARVDLNQTDILNDFDEFTIEMWIKPISLGGMQRLITKGNISNQFTGDQDWWLYLNNDPYDTNLGPVFVIFDGAYTCYPSNYTIVVNGSWYHVGITLSLSGKEIKLYTNGELVGICSGIPVSWDKGAWDIVFGWEETPDWVRYNGLMDEIKFHNTVKDAAYFKTAYERGEYIAFDTEYVRYCYAFSDVVGETVECDIPPQVIEEECTDVKVSIHTRTLLEGECDGTGKHTWNVTFNDQRNYGAEWNCTTYGILWSIDDNWAYLPGETVFGSCSFTPFNHSVVYMICFQKVTCTWIGDTICPDKCIRGTRYYNGKLVEGVCEYEHETCIPDGCYNRTHCFKVEMPKRVRERVTKEAITGIPLASPLFMISMAAIMLGGMFTKFSSVYAIISVIVMLLILHFIGEIYPIWFLFVIIVVGGLLIFWVKSE